MQGSEYASGFEYAKILNIPEFWICLDFTGFKICLNNSRICLIMSGYVWICLNIPQYAWICLNLPEWFLFYMSLFPHFFYNCFSTWTHRYLFEPLQEIRGYSLKELEATGRNIFSIAAGSISFFFCFRLNIFTRKI